MGRQALEIEFLEAALKKGADRTPKVEEVRPNRYSTIREAESSLDRFLRLYNGQRLHSSLGYLSPDQYEAQAGPEGR